MISVESLWVSLHLVWCWLLACYILPLLCLVMFLVSLPSPRHLSWSDAVFHWMLFQHLMRWSCVFFFLQFVCMVDYINRFSYVEPLLHLWDKANLIMVDIFSDAFLGSICQYFTDYICINVHEWDWSAILFLGNVFKWFGYQGNCSFIKRVWQCSLCFYCVEQFEEYWY